MKDIWLVGLIDLSRRLRSELRRYSFWSAKSEATLNGIQFFREIYADYKALNVCLPGYSIPHPVHLREGMQVRNALRELTDYKYDAHWYDGMWIPLTIAAIWDEEKPAKKSCPTDSTWEEQHSVSYLFNSDPLLSLQLAIRRAKKEIDDDNS